MKKLILFDLDGVLVDSRDNMEHAWSAVQDRLSVDTPFSDYFELVGRPFSDILKILGLESKTKEIDQIFKAVSIEGIHLIKFYPDVKNTLLYLKNKGIKLGVVTSKDLVRTKKILSKFLFDFDVVQSPNDRYRGKPAPDHLLLSMAITNTDPDDTIYIGDMNVDFEASSRANIDYLHATWGYQISPKIDIVTISSIKDITECVI